MTLDTIIMLLGALIAALPIMEGLPLSAERPLLFLLGVCVIGCGIVVRRRGFGKKQNTSSTFRESTPMNNVGPSTPESASEPYAYAEHERA